MNKIPRIQVLGMAVFSHRHKCECACWATEQEELPAVVSGSQEGEIAP